ncbi:2-oxoglutarate dehydrogenase complex dihydrolipoyllysine-residue succinyltransferase [Anaeromyxobacter paludicola]|uniref:Dihydrolipoyllysine-residue succinyltransferase n=1 Tax=Anaeromyxobacter paludicola TaxID=2918171 RepID=A0ABM7XF75_9BACT|nr:2-oxoglutarate dehydrogenase complex dihydrolipoyllysine-residue succinyltransferase [Anaeromyxobacter paludicola]BDG10503.1 dihydrolipoyllysine-residue succinyltransferase component of 2-oxoglutarate dehydrogenase complex [Anaeromyxobacter paludicola]
MSVELRVPSIGESITQATLGAWLKQEGEPVRADEPVVEVESEKATVALPAPVSGVLSRVLKGPGDTVAVGEVIGYLEEGAAATAASGPGANPAVNAAPRAAPASPAPAAPIAAAPAPAPTAAPRAAPPPPPGRGPRLPPSARRLLAENGLSADALAGRALRKDDVQRALEAPAPAAPVVAGERERVVAMTPLRRTVARRLVEAQRTAAILTTFNEVDMTRVLALRERHQAAFTERHGVKLGFMSFFVKAAVEALKAIPAVNAEVRGESIVYKEHYDVGVAVGGGKGLVVPVVRDADRLSFAEVELAIAQLAKKARENRITLDELSGGTFTISNGGIYGSLLSTPILNPPQSGILGLHKIEQRAVVRDGQVVARPMMFVALSYDHRLVDGREAVTFLVRVKECIEDPERLLLEV